MRLSIEDVFAISVADYESLYFDETFNEAVGRALQLGRKLLRLTRSGNRVVRHICYEPMRDPESAAGKAFGTSRASFVEELDYDLETRRGDWKTIPNMIPDRVRNAGTIELVEAPGGVNRIVHAEVKVSLFGFGGIVERMVAAEIEKSYASTTRFTNEWIAQRAR